MITESIPSLANGLAASLAEGLLGQSYHPVDMTMLTYLLTSRLERIVRQSRKASIFPPKATRQFPVFG